MTNPPLTSQFSPQRAAALRDAHLVETSWLAEKIAANDPAIRVVDMRGYVRTAVNEDGTQASRYIGALDEFRASHIPGSVYLDWTRDIVDEDDPIPVQIASPEKMARVLGDCGIGDGISIVAYDNHPASQFATRLWWALRYYGFDRVRVLNGGWAKWLREQRPVTDEPTKTCRREFIPEIRPDWRAKAEEIAVGLNLGSAILIDARDEEQFTGKVRRGSRGGRIPGAINLPREIFLASDGVFRESEEIAAIVIKAGIDAGIEPGEPVTAYCNGGVAATSVLFALSMLGFERLRNYDGSWNEWAERSDLPVA